MHWLIIHTYLNLMHDQVLSKPVTITTSKTRPFMGLSHTPCRPPGPTNDVGPRQFKGRGYNPTPQFYSKAENHNSGISHHLCRKHPMGWSDSHVRFKHYTSDSILNPPIKCHSNTIQCRVSRPMPCTPRLGMTCFH